MRIRKGLSEGWAWPSPQDMDKDMDRTVGGEGWGDLGSGGCRWGWGSLFFTLFCLHDHVIQLVTYGKMRRYCSIHFLDCFYGNNLFTTCWFAFFLDRMFGATRIMLRVIVVGLCHTFLDHVLLAKLIMLHDIVVGLCHTIPCDMWCAADLDKDKDWTRGGVGCGELGLGLFFFMFCYRWMCTWACLCKAS